MSGLNAHVSDSSAEHILRRVHFRVPLSTSTHTHEQLPLNWNASKPLAKLDQLLLSRAYTGLAIIGKNSVMLDIGSHVFEFLKLPAELRNRVYYNALVNENLTEITPTLRVPALLQSCYQIRSEARNIWCTQNTFCIRIIDYDTDLLSRFCRILVGHMDYSPGIVYDLDGSCSWSNLMTWCRRVFHGQLWPIFAGPDADTQAVVVSAATRLAASDVHDRWRSCLQGLEMWRDVAGRSNSEWLEN